VAGWAAATFAHASPYAVNIRVVHGFAVEVDDRWPFRLNPTVGCPGARLDRALARISELQRQVRFNFRRSILHLGKATARGVPLELADPSDIGITAAAPSATVREISAISVTDSIELRRWISQHLRHRATFLISARFADPDSICDKLRAGNP